LLFLFRFEGFFWLLLVVSDFRLLRRVSLGLSFRLGLGGI